ncbi:hypothetical protein [Streptomyces sp. NRRL B-24572]|uniref:hypothetical protein n=1 Tax=Streptomyces sp. NRRL B-24572 TaxID=1962156 RepID=UPI000A3B4BFA|nr:hypothetical protein [Streptomyces sp. NRRL B-24572]
MERLRQLFNEGQLWLLHRELPEGTALPASGHEATAHWVRSELVRLGLSTGTVLEFESDMTYLQLGHKADTSLGERHAHIAVRMGGLMRDVATHLHGVDRAMFDIGAGLTRFTLCLTLVDHVPSGFRVTMVPRKTYQAELHRTTAFLQAALTRLTSTVRSAEQLDSALGDELTRLGTLLDGGIDDPESRRQVYRQVRRIYERAGMHPSFPLPVEGTWADSLIPEGEQDLMGRPRAEAVAELKAARDRALATTPAPTEAHTQVALFKELRTQHRLSLGPYELDTLMLSVVLACTLLLTGETKEAIDLAFDTAATAAHHYGDRDPVTALISAQLLPAMRRCGDGDALEEFYAARIKWLFTDAPDDQNEVLQFARAYVISDLKDTVPSEPPGTGTP